LDKGKDHVQHGTLKVGDYMLAGKHHGKIKAMHDERGILYLRVLLQFQFLVLMEQQLRVISSIF
jgi:translation initiation factor IF-2